MLNESQKSDLKQILEEFRQGRTTEATFKASLEKFRVTAQITKEELEIEIKSATTDEPPPKKK